jgi:hypothetical protein
MTQDILRCLKAHFSNPLKRIRQEDEEKLKGIVHFPLKDPSKPGGFTKAGEKWAEDNNLQDLLALSKEHREKVRIEIHAVLKTAWLFLRNRKGAISEEEKNMLCQGIALEDPLNRIQTAKKNGSILTSEFEQSMSSLYKGLSKTSPAAQSCRDILVEAAQEQKIARDKDKNIGASLLNI